MSEELSLWPGASPCVQCGYCCRVRSCGFGAWDETNHRCSELVDLGDGTYGCRKYDEILASKDLSWHISPAFGAGCCSSFNSDRQAILRKK